MEPVSALARPRLGLLGNPSDGYGGRVLATTFDDFRVRVRIGMEKREPAPTTANALTVDRRAGPRGQLDSLLARDGYAPGGVRLMAAAALEFDDWRAVEERFMEAVTFGAQSRFRIEFESDVPRQVGLAGSSAIVIATLRALARYHGLEMPAEDLANRALRAETERLGISAGPQDRVVQAHEGLLAMDFGPKAGARVRRLDAGGLPPLFLVWDRIPGTSSGVAHHDLRARFERGEAQVHQVLDEFASLADAGRLALEGRDHDSLAQLFRESLALRRRIFQLSPADLKKISVAEAEHVAVKLPGSGGALIGIARDRPHAAHLRKVFEAAGFAFLLPQLTHATDSKQEPLP